MGGAQIIFSNAARQISQSINIKGPFIAALSSGWLFLGLFVYVFATVFWLFILARVDIRVAYPIASTAVIFASFFQCINTGSFPSLTYWIGLVAVIFGLTIINHG